MATISHAVTEHRFLSFLDESTDGELLDQFITAKDDSAFAELVRRHAGMVLGVCRRVLHNAHDAEDCFQAAFLVLVRKAETIKPREMVGNWLYGVAYRTALEARKLAARRRIMERKKPAPNEDVDAREDWRDLGPLLDQELNRLPDKYRAVIVACDLEGKTREEAARALGLPEGTVASRLARGRALLAKRLKRFEARMTVVGVAALLLEKTPPEVPQTLLTATIDAGMRLAGGQPTTGLVSRNVASLADAVVAGFYLAKLKIAGVALTTLLLLGVMVGTLFPSTQPERRFKPNAGKAAVVEPGPGKPTRALDCIVHGINREQRTIEALSMSGEQLMRVEVEVTPETQIEINGQRATFAELNLGAALDVLEYTEINGRHTALRIRAAGRWIDGTVSAANENGVQIKADDRMFDVDKDTTVLVDGKKVKFGDLKTKMDVKVKVGPAKGKIERIDAVGPKRKDAVKAIDAATQTITLENAAEALTLAPDAPVYIDGRRETLAGLKAGTRVTLQMSAQNPPCVVAIRSE